MTDDYHRALVQNELVDAIDLYDQRREYRQHAPPEYWETFGAMASDVPEEWHSTTWIGDRAVETLEALGRRRQSARRQLRQAAPSLRPAAALGGPVRP